MVKKGESVDPASLAVTAEEYPALLKRVYKDERFPKPRNAVGLQKDLPVEEMEKLMITNAQVTDDAMTELGNQRAQAVKEWLLKTGQIPQERCSAGGQGWRRWREGTSGAGRQGRAKGEDEPRRFFAQVAVFATKYELPCSPACREPVTPRPLCSEDRVSGKPLIHQRRLAIADSAQKVLGVPHVLEGGIPSVEKLVQFGQPGHMRRPAHRA